MADKIIKTFFLYRLSPCGVSYKIEEWICPICKQQKDSFYINDVIFHGDRMASEHKKGVNKEGCSDCLKILF